MSGALSGLGNTSCDEVEVGGTRQWAGVFLQTFDDVADATSWHGGLSKVPCCCHPVSYTHLTLPTNDLV